MYALAKEHRSAKLFAKTRRTVVPKQFEFDNTIKRDAKDLSELCHITKPLLNGCHFGPQNSTLEITEQHEAMIRYINDSWRSIKQELDLSDDQKIATPAQQQQPVVVSNINVPKMAAPTPKVKYINPSMIPKNFVPFDLESFWGQRIYQNLLRSS